MIDQKTKQNKPQVYVYNIQEVASKWSASALAYQNSDTTMQTGFYTLVNMLRLNDAKNILEVACGTGKLIPYALSLKPLSCSYYATDISEEMVRVTQSYLQRYIQKLGVTESYEKWQKDQNLRTFVHNGELPFPISEKFDRIICNLVFHLTQSPQKMLANLYNSAEEGCLMGITIMGNIEKSSLLMAMKEVHIDLQKQRCYCHLHNRFGEMAEKAGWEVLLKWQQDIPFHFTEVNENLTSFLTKVRDVPEKCIPEILQKINVEFNAKRAMIFPGQLYICRKK